MGWSYSCVTHTAAGVALAGGSTSADGINVLDMGWVNQREK